MNQNGFFKQYDKRADTILGYPIHPTWWSRLYEYPWALDYAKPHTVVADMGCGYEQRPLKNALAIVCEKVYAVDAHQKLLELHRHNNMEFVVANFCHKIEAIQDGELDTIFCISTMEHVPNHAKLNAFNEFYRCLKDGGLLVMTVDAVYDPEKPNNYWPGADLDYLEACAGNAGFKMQGEADYDKTDAVNKELFNLCVYHYVYEKVNGSQDL